MSGNLKRQCFFNQDENSVVLPSSANMISGKILDNTLAPILKTYLDRELKTVTMAMTFCDQIERLLYANRIDPPITAKKVAFHMGVSEPTALPKASRRRAQVLQYAGCLSFRTSQGIPGHQQPVGDRNCAYAGVCRFRELFSCILSLVGRDCTLPFTAPVIDRICKAVSL